MDAKQNGKDHGVEKNVKDMPKYSIDIYIRI